MRLTEKKNGTYWNYGNFVEIIDKLGQLEDIEEELGIDLITLFKALKDGVYYKYKDMGVEKISKLRPITIHKNTIVCDYHTYKYFKDYGKTWALTKEELL